MSPHVWLPHLWTNGRESAAAEARSILACPRAASLQVDGIEDLVEDDELSLLDDAGTPVLLTFAGSPLDRAAGAHTPARLSVTSDLSLADGAPSRVVLVGRLQRHHACSRGQVVVTLDIDHVLLQGDHPSQPTVAVTAEDFGRPEHRLNRGYLDRSARHANQSHQKELRQAVALATGVRPNNIAGVQLEDLTAVGVALTWIDSTGAHRTDVTFDQPAASPEELAALLSQHLHSDLC